MFESILAIAALLLSLVGLSELLHRLWLLLLRPGAPRNCLLTLLDDETAVQQLRADLEQIRWIGRGCADCVIAVDCGLPASVAADCRELARQNTDVVFCAGAELPDLIKQLKEACYVGRDGKNGSAAGNR